MNIVLVTHFSRPACGARRADVEAFALKSAEHRGFVA